MPEDNIEADITEEIKSEEIKPEEIKPEEKTMIVGVRFRSCGKVYTFKAGDIDVVQGSRVVVESDMGLSLAHVVIPKKPIEKPDTKMKKVVRIATEEDFETARSNRPLEDEAKAFCVEKSREYKLDMKVVTTETTLDKKRLVFYFTADGRIDFRELVRDLAAKFKTRIEMRQIGVRDEVRLLGGIGACGRQACCSLFLTSFEPITIRMAKKQDLSINQNKLSGICGRLMCCLGYEYKNYKSVPRPDKRKIAAEKEQALKDNKSVKEEAASSARQARAAALKNRRPLRDSMPESRTEKKEGDVSPEQKKTVEGERPVRRRRRRRPPHSKKTVDPKAEKKPSESPVKEQTGEKQQQPSAAPVGKGRPFNKRRKFRKKGITPDAG